VHIYNLALDAYLLGYLFTVDLTVHVSFYPFCQRVSSYVLLNLSLQVPPLAESDSVQKPVLFEHKVKKRSVFALGLLAVMIISLFSSHTWSD